MTAPKSDRPETCEALVNGTAARAAALRQGATRARLDAARSKQKSDDARRSAEQRLLDTREILQRHAARGLLAPRAPGSVEKCELEQFKRFARELRAENARLVMQSCKLIAESHEMLAWAPSARQRKARISGQKPHRERDRQD